MQNESENEVVSLKSKLEFNELTIEQLRNKIDSLKKKLEISKKEYNELYDFTPIPFITLDKNHLIQSINFQAASSLGYDRRSLINKLFLNYISSKSKIIYENTIHILFETRFKQTFDVEILQKERKRNTVTLECSLLENNELYRICLIDNSVTNNLIAYNYNLRKSYNLINNWFTHSSEGIAILDNQLNLKIINETFINVFSKIINTQVTKGMNLIKALNDFPYLKTKIMDTCDKALEGIAIQLVIENPEKSTGLYHYVMSVNPIFNHNDENNSNELIIRIIDHTHFKLEEIAHHKQQTEIALSNRTSAMVEMTSALVHEINQPLTAITAYSNTCLYLMNNQDSTAQINPQLLKSMEKISTQAIMAGEIIHNIKNIMRERIFHFEETNINQLIEDTLSILYYEVINFKLNIKLNLMDNLPPVMTNKTHIMQIILNLARNSIEALQSSGEKKPELIIETHLDKDNIYVDIKDNGPGIPKEFRNLILNTNFTTKRKGTGIGLEICRTLIEEHGGKLSVQQPETKGAWFTFNLPINLAYQETHEQY